MNKRGTFCESSRREAARRPASRERRNRRKRVVEQEKTSCGGKTGPPGEKGGGLSEGREASGTPEKKRVTPCEMSLPPSGRKNRFPRNRIPRERKVSGKKKGMLKKAPSPSIGPRIFCRSGKASRWVHRRGKDGYAEKGPEERVWSAFLNLGLFFLITK